VSEQGWREFVAVEDLDDWVVLHGGATAVFAVGSIRESAGLADALAAIPGMAGSGTLLTIADARLTVRLSRDLWKLEPQHVELARAVSAVAKSRGAIADRSSVQEVQFAIAAKPDEIDVDFCRAVLGWRRSALAKARHLRWAAEVPLFRRSRGRGVRQHGRVG
jgi:4a-hydroxytetrahydrobiopterin dehydratase